MVLITGNATFNAESTSNNKVSKDDGKLNLSFVKEATSIIENTGSDVNNNQKEQLVTSVFENQLGQGEKKKTYVQGFSHLVTGERMAAQDSGSVPSVALSQASEVLDAEKVNNLKEAFQNNLRKFEASNPRQWLAINNHAPFMESILEETNNNNKIFESETEKYIVRLDYNLSTQTYTLNDNNGSANVDDIETTMFLVVDKYVKDENGKWVYKSSSLANEIETEFPLKGDFTTTINDKEIYVGTVEVSVNDPRNKDINGLDITEMNFNQKLLTNLKSGNTIGVTSLLNENTKYRQINGDIFGPGVDMSNRVLKDIDLSGMNLHGANFNKTKFINVTSGRISGQPYLSDDYKLINRYIVGPYVNLENALLRDSNLNNINITGANLTGANLNRITSSNVTHDENTKLPENYKIVNGYIVGANVILEDNIDFRSADLTGVSFSNVNVKSADFTGANLTGTILEKADFTDANLSGIISGNIQGGSIIKNTLVKLPKHYIFYNGYILGPGVNLKDVDLTQFDFSLSTFYNLKLTNIIGTPKLPSGYVMRGGFVVGKYMDFSNEDLSQLDFSELDVSNSVFTGANITALNLTNTIMNNVVSGNIEQTQFFGQRYKLINGFLVGPGLNFNGAQLASVDLTGVLFNGSFAINVLGIPRLPDNYKLINQNIVGKNIILTGANFEFENLSETDLRGVVSGQVLANETTTLPENYKIIGGYVIGPEVILTGADLRDLDLSQTILQRVVSGRVKTNKNTIFPSGYKEVLGYIVGKDVNLTGANLKGGDLRNVDMSNAILSRVSSGNIRSNPNSKLPTDYIFANGFIVGPEVILGDADMTNALLTGAYLKTVDVSKVTFKNTIFPEGYVYKKNTLIGPGLILDGVDFTDLDLRTVNFEFVRGSNIQSNEQTQLPIDTGLIDGHIITRNADLRGADLSSLQGVKNSIGSEELRKYVSTYGDLKDSFIYIIDDPRLKDVKTTGLIIDETTILPKNVTLHRKVNLLGVGHDLSDGNFSNEVLRNLFFENNKITGANFSNSDFEDHRWFQTEYIAFRNNPFSKDRMCKFYDNILTNSNIGEYEINQRKIVSNILLDSFLDYTGFRFERITPGDKYKLFRGRDPIPGSTGYEHIFIINSVFNNAIFSGYSFYEIDFIDCDFNNVNFSRIGQESGQGPTTFTGAESDRANGVEMINCSFKNANFKSCYFTLFVAYNSNFEGCDFSEISVNGKMDLREAESLKYIKSKDIRIDTRYGKLFLPSNYKFIEKRESGWGDKEGFIAGPYVDLRGMDLSRYSNITDVNLEGVLTDENTIGPDGTRGWNPN